MTLRAQRSGACVCQSKKPFCQSKKPLPSSPPQSRLLCKARPAACAEAAARRSRAGRAVKLGQPRVPKPQQEGREPDELEGSESRPDSKQAQLAGADDVEGGEEHTHIDGVSLGEEVDLERADEQTLRCHGRGVQDEREEEQGGAARHRADHIGSGREERREAYRDGIREGGDE
eukprot:CAMPEP_0115842286 /NCGR_PEP_ID=MMETSP0287-20121206/7722_1 /TAXON_ID=412157 /ORGANISM="Chrysochromulina rotalis, Strain UIO044" /LENGTH=173 /DNA_ID=CAMNT_0003295951 /DNA_START=333 /DNA_END=851 /DNA_ORIENTATION=+